MKNELRALLIVLVTVGVAAACAGQGERVSDSAGECRLLARSSTVRNHRPAPMSPTSQ